MPVEPCRLKPSPERLTCARLARNSSLISMSFACMRSRRLLRWCRNLPCAAIADNSTVAKTSRLLGAFRHLIRLPTREHSALLQILDEERQLSDGVTVTALSNLTCTRPAKSVRQNRRGQTQINNRLLTRRTGKFSRIRLKPHDTIGVLKSSRPTY